MYLNKYQVQTSFGRPKSRYDDKMKWYDRAEEQISNFNYLRTELTPTLFEDLNNKLNNCDKM